MIARDLVEALKSEGAKGSSPIRVLFEDGSIGDILMIEGDEGTIYLKVEDAS